MKARGIIFALIGMSLICGLLMLFFGIRGTIERNATMRGYATTEGYLLDYQLYAEGNSGRRKTNDTYRLIYNYHVAGREYKVATDYGTGAIPEIGSTKEIRYDPKHPERALIMGPNSNTLLIYGGCLFAGVPLVFLFAFAGKRFSWGRQLINPFDICVGVVLIAAGLGAFYVPAGSFRIAAIIEALNWWALVPLLLVIAGGYQLLRSLFFPEKGMSTPSQTK